MICTTYFLTFFSELIPPTGNYYFFIYNGLPPNNSYFQKVITNILTQKHGIIQNKRYICNLIS